MPRIYNKQSDPIDFCNKHFPNENDAIKKYDVGDDGPDGRGDCFAYEADHPDYDTTDYTCEICNKKLTSKDN